MLQENAPIISIEFLDKALMNLRSQGPFKKSTDIVPKFSQVEVMLLLRAYRKLKKDGYAYSKKTSPSEHHNRVQYFISFDGLVAMESCPGKWKDKPYEWAASKEVTSVVWTVTKTAAVLLNALLVLAFIILTFVYKK